MVAVNTAYRLAPDHPFPAPLNDLRQALTWMADQADDLGIDADRVGAFGYSAGAHLVSLLALTQPSRGPGPAARLRIVFQRIKAASVLGVLRGLVSNPIGAVRLGRQVDFRDRTGKARTAAG